MNHLEKERKCIDRRLHDGERINRSNSNRGRVSTSDLIGHRFGEIEPFPLFVIIDVAQTEIVFLNHIQLLADVVEQVLGLTAWL